MQALLLAGTLLAYANAAFANWWIVRASDGACLVVDIEPTSNNETVAEGLLWHSAALSILHPMRRYTTTE
jgi:hypothetical protein